MDLGLQGKVAIITGGSEGIGRAAAQSLGREGARVVVCGRRVDVLERAAADVAEATGAEIVAVPADVSQAADVARLVQTTIDRFGRLDILVNNAGRSRALPFEEATDEEWQADLDLKLFAALRGIRAAVPHLRAGGGGSIVNILNLGAKAPGPRSMPTSVSRAAGLAHDQGAVQGVRGRQHSSQRHPDRSDQERPARAHAGSARAPRARWTSSTFDRPPTPASRSAASATRARWAT